MNGDPMSAASRDAIGAAQNENFGVYVSPITAWEVATLAAKNRLQLTLSPEAWFDTLLGLPCMRLAPMPLIASAALPGIPPKDPADRIIAATARTFGYMIITRDG